MCCKRILLASVFLLSGGAAEAQLRVPDGVTVETLVADISNPQALALDNLGHLFVAHDGEPTSQIYKVTVADGSVVAWGPTAQDPDAVAVDADNNVYIGDGSGKVYKVTPAGDASIFSTAFLGNVCSMTVDKFGHYGEAGTVLVGNARASADVVQIEPDQTATVFQSSSNLHVPFGLLVHPNGHVFIAEFSAEVSNITGLYQVDSEGSLEMVHDFLSPFALAHRASTDEIFVSDVQDAPSTRSTHPDRSEFLRKGFWLAGSLLTRKINSMFPTARHCPTAY